MRRFARWIAVVAVVVVGLIGERSAAQTLGIIADDASNRAVVFNADTDTITGSVLLPGANLVGDCSINNSQTLGFVTDFASHLFVINLVPPALAPGTNPVPISNFGEDVDLTADQNFAVVCDGSAVQPVSSVNIATRTQVSTLATGSPDCNSVDVATNGSVLVTSSSSGNLRRLLIDGAGTLTNTGEVAAIGAEPNNVVVAPGNASGVVINRSGGTFRSFTIPGLAFVDTRTISGAGPFGLAGVFNAAGDRLFVRGNNGAGGTVDVYAYTPATGAVGAVPLFSIAVGTTPTFFGMDQLALHPSGGKVYVSWAGGVRVYSAATGALLTTIASVDTAGPTGVCFAAVAGAPSCVPHRVHGHLNTSPTGPHGSNAAAHQHHGQHGHTVGANCPGHQGPLHMTLLPDEGQAPSSELDFASYSTEDGGRGPVEPGSAVQLFGSSRGLFLDLDDRQPAETFAAPASGSPLFRTTTLPEVRIGGKRARVLFSGLAPGLTGVWQINVVVPEELPAGPASVSVLFEGDQLRSVDLAIR